MAVVPKDPPSAYRVTYRIDTGAPLGSSRSNEVLSVLRPFSSSLVNTSPDGKPIGEQHGTLGKIRVSGEPRPTVLGLAADIATSDTRLDAAYADLVERRLVEVRERRVVQGRPGQVLRSKDALQGAKAPAGFNASDYVETCVDARALVLAQVIVADADPRTTTIYDRRRENFDRHAAYVVVAFVAGG